MAQLVAVDQKVLLVVRAQPVSLELLQILGQLVKLAQLVK
jgi:hypothetical protein